MRPLRLLFPTQEAAREVAFMLRCKYDGCNMITLPARYDTLAVTTAIELTGSDFCFDGDHYPLVLPFSREELSQLSDEQLAERISHKFGLWNDLASF